MPFEEPIEPVEGRGREIAIGSGPSTVTVGGEAALPFHFFDGPMPHWPLIALEVYDTPPEGWPEALTDALGGLTDPAGWARECAEVHDADMVCVQLAGTDPNGAGRSPTDAAETVSAVAGAVDVPLVVYGSGNAENDAEVLKCVAESCEGAGLYLGPVTEDNYRAVTAAALAYGHGVIAETPIDVNMAKQLNILITQLGLDATRILIDPSVGAVGYGIEYAYTVMERLRLAALVQRDDMTQMPIICNLAKEAWRAKEARVGQDEEPTWGDPTMLGVLWEAVTALTLTMAGADVLVMRHPEAAAVLRKAFEGLADQ